MNSDDLAELFGEAITYSDLSQRRAWLHAKVGDDQELLQELESLLLAHDAAADFLEEPAVAEAANIVPIILGSNLIGSSIGSWRIDSLVHAGGMGSVFHATRIEDDFSQAGALKLVRVGFETAELIARFSSERQLLASIEHPHIARLLDGGTTTEGLPWLAMEYVDGLPINTYADDQILSIEQRLDFFAQLLSAIAYLHENLILHRDIKASNVMVDGNGHVRVLDFGISSLLDEAATQLEVKADRRLSLATAAPEQLRGEPVSTATDVYSLGVLLYQLLCGQMPYRIDSTMSAAQIESMICEQVPPLASSAVTSDEQAIDQALLRSTTPRAMAAKLRGDLDMILGKALHKDPLCRYRSIEALEADIHCFRNDRPIEARPNTAAYRSSKFARRHWRGLSATAAVMLALLVGLSVAMWQAEEARRQRDRAQAMNAFMREVLAEADPYESRGDKTVRTILNEASALLGSRFVGQPLLEASLREVIGGVQSTLLALDEAEKNLNNALILLEGQVPDDDEIRLRAESYLAWIDFSREQDAAAEARYLSVIERLHDGHSEELRASVHSDLAVLYNFTEHFDKAIEQAQLALAVSLDDKHDGKPDGKSLTATLINLGVAYDGLGDLEEAKRYYLEAIDRLQAMGEGGRTLDLAHALNNYGNVLSQEDRDEEALPYYLESLKLRQEIVGDDSDSVATQHLNVGRLLLDMQRPSDALQHLERSLALLPNYREYDSIYLRLARGSYARAILLTSSDMESLSRAVTVLEETLAALRADSGGRESRFAVQFEGWLNEARNAEPAIVQPL